jgi:carbamoylphosphate synthase small subunit
MTRKSYTYTRRVWRYQSGNQKPCIEEEQTTQWPKEKGQTTIYKILNRKLNKAWRYQSGNQNPCIKEEQTAQWPKEKVQKDKQRSTKHTHKTKDRVTRTPLKTGGELRCSGKVSS